MLYTVRISNPENIFEATFVDGLTWGQAVILASTAKHSYTAILDNEERDYEHNGYNYWPDHMEQLSKAMPWVF